jgi:hypothetical protein
MLHLFSKRQHLYRLSTYISKQETWMSQNKFEYFLVFFRFLQVFRIFLEYSTIFFFKFYNFLSAALSEAEGLRHWNDNLPLPPYLDFFRIF